MWLVSTGSVAGNLPFRLETGDYVVGRTKGAQIVIRDQTVSRRHARLIHSRGELVVEDLSSVNGTFVNEKRVTRSGAEVGSEIRFGGVVCLLASSAILPTDGLDRESTMAARTLAAPTVQMKGVTPAQQEVITLVLRGLDEAEIASMLGRSPHTVHTHLKAIFRHFQVHSRAELIVKLVQRQ
jgi:S-DNA-T family DNA segregation ATPase FtsK/SpoIIIE